MASLGDKLMLPVDHVVAPSSKAVAKRGTSSTIPDGKMASTSARRPSQLYADVIRGAKTIIWNGPMGIFEKPPFDKGTVALAKAVAEFGRRIGGRRRRLREGHQGGRRVRQDLARFHRRRRFAGIPGGIELPGVAALTDKIGG